MEQVGRTQNMGGDIAEWSARQIHASYDERDQISIVTVLRMNILTSNEMRNRGVYAFR